jgi:hypothetical protein
MIIRLIISGILGALLLTFCTNPFTTRQAEEPDELVSDIFIQPTECRILKANFSRAIEQKNTVNYMKCFVDSTIDGRYPFTFVPENHYADYFVQTWELSDEENYFNNIVSGENPPRLKFEYTDTTLTELPPDHAEFDFGYNLKVIYNDTVTYQGKGLFKLFRSDENSCWYIYFWQDYAVDENYELTWTNLKLLNR